MRGDVPAPPGALVGRDELLGAIVDHVRAHRLTALTGVGGVGKTRLALEVATIVGDEFPDGVWFVGLDAVAESAAVADAVATALAIAPHGSTPMIETVAGALAGRPLLLVLDNCEHVSDAVEGLIEALCARPGEVKILTTSRVTLAAANDHEVVVAPLAFDGGRYSPAVTLFTARARAVRPNFALDDGPATASAVVEICRVLDGLPLGIELAAARMAGMGAIDVRDRLGDRFRLLEGAPDAPRRQQTLSDLVQWSVELLAAEEREVLERAAVFVGGFDVEAYVGVFGVDDDIAVLRALDRLVRSSLVVADHADGRVRYRMLETIREHGLEALAEASELDAANDAHAAYFARVITSHWARWNGPEWRATVDWLTTELANLRSALRWSSARDVEVAADIAAHAALIGTSANVFEPIGWAEALLEPATAADIVRLPRLCAAAGYACFVARAESAVSHAERAIALEAEPGYDPCPPGMSAFIGALANVYAGNLGRYVELAAAAARLPGDARAFALPALVDGLQASGHVDEALDLLDDAVAAARDVGSPFWLAYALWIAGTTLSRSDPARALAAWDQGLDVVADHDVVFFSGFLARDAARLHAASGDPTVALSLFERAIDEFHQSGNLAQLVITLASVPALLERLGRNAAAATLCAAMSAVPASTEHVPELAAIGDRVAVTLGAAVAGCLAAGRAMDLDQGTAYARSELAIARDELARSTSEQPPGGLTRRELEILRLVADGLTTRAIAERLFISAKTADRHIQNLYTKIGTSTRATATRWAVDHGVVARAPGGQTGN